MTVVEPMVSEFIKIHDALNETKIKIAIEQNGMTPSRGFIAESAKYVHEKKRSLDVLISANNENNVFNDSEIKIMEDDLFQCQELGVDGVFVGSLNKDKTLDTDAMQTLAAAAGGMQLYLSLVFDNIPEKNWENTFKWLDENNFTGVVASAHLSKVKTALEKFPNLQLIPFTTDNDELQKVTDEINPLVILNKM